MDNYIDSNGYTLDLAEAVIIPLTKSVDDVTQPNKRQRDFSKTIDVVGTPNNLLFFKGCFSFTSGVDSVSDYDPTARVPARLYSDGELIMDSCVIKLNYVKYNNGNYTFNINLFAEITDIFLGMDQRLVSDLDLSDMNHVLNKVNVQSTWDGSKDYVYPLIDIGDRAIGDVWRTNDMYPYVWVKELVNRIMASNGYQVAYYIQSDVLKLFDNAVFGFGGGKRLGLTPTEINQRKAVSNYNVSFDWQGSNNSVSVLDMMNTGAITNNFTPGQDIFNQVSTQFLQTNIALTGKYRVTLNYDLAMTIPAGATNVSNNMIIGIIVNNIGRGTFPNTNISTTNLTSNGTISVELELSQGDQVKFGFSGGQVSNLNQLIDGAALDLTGSSLIIESIDEQIIDGAMVDVAMALPAMTQKEFITGVIKWLNLQVSNPDDNGLINIYTSDVYYLPSNINTDISQIVDYSKDIIQYPLANDYGKNITFRFKENKDLDNLTYLNRWGDNYGDFTTQNPSSYSIGDQVFELPFSNIVPYKGLVNSNAVYPRFVQLDNQSVLKPLAGNARIAIYNGMQVGAWKFADSYGTNVTNETSFPCIHHFDNYVTPSVDMNYSLPREVYYLTSNFTNLNAFTMCYQSLISELTSRESRLFKINIKISNLDFKNWDFRRLLYWDGGLYKCNKVIDFDSNATDSTTVEMIKVVESTSRPPEMPLSSVINVLTNPTRSQMPINSVQIMDIEEIHTDIIVNGANGVILVNPIEIGFDITILAEFDVENVQVTLVNTSNNDININNGGVVLAGMDSMNFVNKNKQWIPMLRRYQVES